MSKKSSASAWGAGRVAFLARRELIQQALDAGWSIRAAFQRYAADAGMSYSQFTRYVNRYLKDSHAASKAPPTPLPESPAQDATLKSGPKKLDVNLPRFHWNPTAPNKDDLI